MGIIFCENRDVVHDANAQVVGTVTSDDDSGLRECSRFLVLMTRKKEKVSKPHPSIGCGPFLNDDGIVRNALIFDNLTE